jgi:hypothetical protein
MTKNINSINNISKKNLEIESTIKIPVKNIFNLFQPNKSPSPSHNGKEEKGFNLNTINLSNINMFDIENGKYSENIFIYLKDKHDFLNYTNTEMLEEGNRYSLPKKKFNNLKFLNDIKIKKKYNFTKKNLKIQKFKSIPIQTEKINIGTYNDDVLLYSEKIQLPPKNIKEIQNVSETTNLNFLSNSSILDLNSSYHCTNYLNDASFSSIECNYLNEENKKQHETISFKEMKYKKLSFDDVKNYILEKYITINEKNTYSSELDILITYLRGQKNLFIKSKNFYEFYYYLFNIFIIGIILFTSVSSNFIYTYTWGINIITGVNSFLSIIFPIFNYLKLESAIEKYSLLIYQYEDLETGIEFASNKLYFIKNETERNDIILQKLDYIDNKLQEIREYNSILIPDNITFLFPIISNINMFTFIKKVENYKTQLILQLQNTKNNINKILFNIKKKNKNQNIYTLDSENKLSVSSDSSSSSLSDNENEQNNFINTLEYINYKKQLNELVILKDNIKEQLIECNNSFNIIDEIFTKEIKISTKYNNFLFITISPCCYFHDDKINIDSYKNNKIIYETLQSILE